MSIFSLSKNRDSSDQARDRIDLRLSQIKNQNEELLLILRDIKQKETGWPQDKSDELLNQGTKALDQMESLLTAIIETNYKLEEMDKSLFNNITSSIYQIREEQAALKESNLKVQKKVKGNRGFLWMVFILQFISLGGIGFIILYLLDYIYF